MILRICSIGLWLVFVMAIPGCFKNCKEAKYLFSMQTVFFPEKDNIHVGDTIWLSSSHTTIFRDSLTGNQIDFSNSQIGVNLRVLTFNDSSKSYMGAISDFTIIKSIGQEAGNNNIPSENKGFFYAEEDGLYSLKLGFVPHKQGEFLISCGNSMGIIRGNHGCEKADIQIVNANFNNHLSIFQRWWPGYEIPTYERTHSYLFKVN